MKLLPERRVLQPYHMIQQLSCPVCLSGNLQQCLTAKDYTATGEVFPIIHCHDCTARFTGVIPEPDQMGRYYHADSYISHTDTRKGLVHQLYHWVRGVTLKLKRKLVNRLAGTTQGTLLDVGCGTGAFAGTMQQAGWKVIAVEPEAQARKVALELHQIEALPAEALNTLNISADVITLWHVLEHVHDVHEYMNHLHRLLSNNGVLLIAVPNYSSLDATHYEEYWAAWDVPRHLYHFSPASMRQLAAMHQFTVEQTLPMWFDSFYVSMLSEKYRGSRLGFLQGMFTGLRSNIHALRKRERCSSLIYVLRKKKD